LAACIPGVASGRHLVPSVRQHLRSGIHAIFQHCFWTRMHAI
jgi:hypothetical protein